MSGIRTFGMDARFVRTTVGSSITLELDYVVGPGKRRHSFTIPDNFQVVSESIENDIHTVIEKHPNGAEVTLILPLAERTKVFNAKRTAQAL